MQFKVFVESTAQELWQSAVSAFPGTKKRQHAIDPIVIENLKILPFVGMKTLFLKSDARNEDKTYNPIFIFKGVNYQSPEYSLAATDGKIYTFGRLSLSKNEVLTRCSCPDFYWRFQHYNHLDGSLQGRNRSSYKRITENMPAANPLELPGLCKHLMKFAKTLQNSGVVSE